MAGCRNLGLDFSVFSHLLTKALILYENIFTAPPRPDGWRWCFHS